MPTLLPPSTDITASGTKQGGAKVYHAAIRAFIAALLGTDAEDKPAARAALGAQAASDVLSSISASGIRSYLAGLTLSTAGSSATMSIAAGQAADSTNYALMSCPAIAKTTAAWAVGTAVGGLDSGAITNSTWYHFYVIRRPDTGVVDALISLSATAPTLPADYTQFRRIGSGRTNSAGQWTAFVQDGDYFAWQTSVVDVAALNPGGGTAVAAVLSVPPGVKVDAIIQASIVDSAQPYVGMTITDLSTSDVAPNNANNQDAFCPVVGLPSVCSKLIRTNTSAQIRYRTNVSSASLTVSIRTLGWYDSRGRNA